jgi:hypothetical protein
LATRSNREQKTFQKKRIGLMRPSHLLPTCATRNLTRKGKESQPLGHFQDLLEAYGDFPADITMDAVTEGEKSYSRVRFLVAQCGSRKILVAMADVDYQHAIS